LKIPHSPKNPSLANSLTNPPPLKHLAHPVPNSAPSVALNHITNHVQSVATNPVVHANLVANALIALNTRHKDMNKVATLSVLNMPLKVMNKVAALSAPLANLVANVHVCKSIPW
jgi:hypothetical protein